MMKTYKLMFLITLIIGSLVSISSYSWMGMWMGLEINLLAMIPLMNNEKSTYSSESSIKYFITQALASSILLFSVICILSMEAISVIYTESSLIFMMNSSLMTKMGTAPFHFWFPEIIEGLNWINCFILLTWQKIAPMLILMGNMKSMLFITMIILFSMTIGGIMNLNQMSMRKILVFSSINHMGWMLMAMMMSKTIWIIYFLIYTMILAMITFFMNEMKIFFMKQMITQMKNKPLLKLNLWFNFLSLGGLPPFMGFFPKWLVINKMIEKNMITMAVIMVILTLVTLFIYARIMFMMMMISSSQPKFLKMADIKMPMILINTMNIFGLLMSTMIFNFT